jgi:lipopolysaccharide transport system ATP-binding protein
MNDIAISVKNISKVYRLGERMERYRTLRDTITDCVTAPWRALKRISRRRDAEAMAAREFWALKNVSLEIKRGDVVGIIGRNGAGKSTLLKVLSRITEPTSGCAEIHGRIGSLLEVGTGFHPELTGRENVFLNGAILGMKRREIERKFDEIVAFSEVEKFIDTPVKHYSSGMNLRLAFAVAAHLDPEILLVDEVLAVGDIAFQKKCIGKMDEVAKVGRTILFVSHNMGTIRSLCNTGIFLDGGKVGLTGRISDCIERYYKAIGAYKNDDGEDAGPDVGARSGFGAILLNDKAGNSVAQDEPLSISTTLRIPRPVNGFRAECLLKDMEGRRVFCITEESKALGLKDIEPGAYAINIELPAIWLNPGSYAVQFKVRYSGEYGGVLRHRSDVFPMDVVGASSRAEAVLNPRATWSVERNDYVLEPCQEV